MSTTNSRLQLITRLAFSTPSCSKTPSADRVNCRLYEEQPHVRCLPLSLASSTRAAVECEWNLLETTTNKEQQSGDTTIVESDAVAVGYRAVLSASSSPDSPNITIVPAAVHQLRYELIDGADYRLVVQAMTAGGLGRQVHTEFRTGASGGLLHEFRPIDSRDGRSSSDSRFVGAPLEATLSRATSSIDEPRVTWRLVLLFLLWRWM